jgi:4-amino-4-deoxy-L-arabinose transferase-like glycosyltransferase
MQRWMNNFIQGLWRQPHRLVIGIISVSVCLRVVAALYLGNTVEELPGTFDQISYHNLALRVLGGHGFTFDVEWWPITPAGEPTAHWSYLYTFYLVGIYALFGPNPLAARLIQAVLVGILHPWITYQIGRKVFSEAVGLLAALITAVYAYFVYYAGTLMTEPFYISAIMSGLLLSINFIGKDQQESQVKFGLRLGLVLGITVLFRQLYLLFVPFLLAWVGWSKFHLTRRIPWVGISITLAIMAMLVSPFTIFNYARFNRFVLLNTNSGYAFFWGNHPIYGSHFVPILTPEMGSYQDLIPVEVRQLNEAELDQELLRRGIQFVVDEPLRYLLLSLSRIPAYFMFWPSSGSGLISNVSRVISFGLFLPFMVVGLIRALHGSALTHRKPLLNFLLSSQGLLVLFMLFYSAVHLLTWALIRYRLPVDAVLIFYAGVGLLFLGGRIWPRIPGLGQLQSG